MRQELEGALGDRPKDRWGGQGETYKAKRKSDRTTACLKILRGNNTEERRRRFIQEANALAIIDHPRVPRLIETNASRDQVEPASGAAKLYLATEFIPGPNLADHVTDNGLIPLPTAIAMARELLATLTALHPAHVHRDIKPENIILRAADPLDPVLVDFGLSASDDDDRSHDTSVDQELGNRFLRLPEVASGSENKRRAVVDLTFVAGVLLFAVTGQRPGMLSDAEGRLPHQRSRAREALRNAVGVDGSKLVAILDRAFQNDISRRFDNAARLSDELAAVLGEPADTDSAEAILGSLRARFGEVPPEQAQEYEQRNRLMQRWVAEIHDGLRGRLPPNVGVWELAGYCEQHRGSRIVCQRKGFQVFDPKPGHVLPHLVSEIVGDEVVLTGEHEDRVEPLARCLVAEAQPPEADRRRVEQYFARCLDEYFIASTA